MLVVMATSVSRVFCQRLASLRPNMTNERGRPSPFRTCLAQRHRDDRRDLIVVDRTGSCPSRTE
jgi:hypothetical protein